MWVLGNDDRLFDRDVRGLVKFFSRLQGGAYTPDVSLVVFGMITVGLF